MIEIIKCGTRVTDGAENDFIFSETTMLQTWATKFDFKIKYPAKDENFMYYIYHTGDTRPYQVLNNFP